MSNTRTTKPKAIVRRDSDELDNRDYAPFLVEGDERTVRWLSFSEATAIAKLVAAGATLDDAELDVFGYDEPYVPTCSICDGVGHGYPGAGPCPLEDRGYDTDGVWR